MLTALSNCMITAERVFTHEAKGTRAHVSVQTCFGPCLFWGGPFFVRLGGGPKNWELSHGSWWQGVHGSWLQSQNAELSSLLAFSCVVLASQKCLQSQGSGGPGREPQNCRRFWIRLLSSHLRTAPHFVCTFLLFLFDCFGGRSLAFGLSGFRVLGL